MKIDINKEKLLDRIKIESTVSFVLITLSCFFMAKFMIYLIDTGCYGDCTPFNANILMIPVLLVAVILSALLYLLRKMYVNSLEYIINVDRLQKNYQVIIKTKDSARLQIINSVDIQQGIIDKIFGHFSIKICYGMGSGHYFNFDYLTEKQADELMEKITPTGKGVLIK